MQGSVPADTPLSSAQPPSTRRADPIADGELGLIARDLASRAQAHTALVAVWDPHHRFVRTVHTVGVADEKARLSITHPSGGRGFVGRLLATGRAAAEPIEPAHDRSLGLTAAGAPVRFAAGAPILPPDGPAGALCIGYSTPPPHRNPSLTLWIVERYAGLASLCIYDAGVLDGLLAAARTDGLTGCLNHTAIHSELHRELERNARDRRPLSCLFIDLDRFKQVNESYGHPHGSQVLAAVAAALRDGMRVGDTLGRYGGDEFIAILPDTDQRAATALAERLRSTIGATTPNGAHASTGVSIGVAQARPGCTADELLAAADDALRTAKGAGGGLVVGAGDIAARRAASG